MPPRRNPDASTSAPNMLTRPMTSKEVQKAYKKRQPRMTRAELAEHRRQDKLEQERLKKEFEREKAAAKAKLARERKKDKDKELEKKVKAERLKKGLAPVSVRPSQDTMTRFFRAPQFPAPRWMARNVKVPQREEPRPRKTEHTGEETTGGSDEVKPCLSFSGSQLLDDDELERELALEASAEVQPKQPAGLPKLASADMIGEVGTERLGCAKSTPLEEPAGHVKASQSVFEGDELDLDVDTICDLAEARQPTPQAVKPASPRAAPPAATIATRLEMGPPPLPNAAASLTTTRTLPPTRNSPPASTQAIFSNIDTLFPSSSQIARELDDDDLNPSTARTSQSARPSPPTESQPKSTIFAADVPMQHPSKSVDTSGPHPRTPLQPLQSQNNQPRHPPSPSDQGSSPRCSPKRFFTSSDTTQRIHLAIHRSKREASLQQLQEREKDRIQAGIMMRRQKKDRQTKASQHSVRSPCEKSAWNGLHCADPVCSADSLKRKRDTLGRRDDDKENQPPLGKAPRCSVLPEQPPTPSRTTFTVAAAAAAAAASSQETEYGGDWVDDLALDILLE